MSFSFCGNKELEKQEAVTPIPNQVNRFISDFGSTNSLSGFVPMPSKQGHTAMPPIQISCTRLPKSDDDERLTSLAFTVQLRRQRKDQTKMIKRLGAPASIWLVVGWFLLKGKMLCSKRDVANGCLLAKCSDRLACNMKN